MDSTIGQLRKSQRTATNAQCTREQFLDNLSFGEISHGPKNLPLRQPMSLKTCFFKKKYLTQKDYS
jgi:hypothetical protein